MKFAADADLRIETQPMDGVLHIGVVARQLEISLVRHFSGPRDRNIGLAPALAADANEKSFGLLFTFRLVRKP